LPRDNAVASFAEVVVKADAERALLWAQSISDAARRDEAAEKLLKTWLSRHEASARRWITKSSMIAPAVVERVLSFRP
jgi:hypothetical protein